jgi:hypothetical protein
MGSIATSGLQILRLAFKEGFNTSRALSRSLESHYDGKLVKRNIVLASIISM